MSRSKVDLVVVIASFSSMGFCFVWLFTFGARLLVDTHYERWREVSANFHFTHRALLPLSVSNLILCQYLSIVTHSYNQIYRSSHAFRRVYISHCKHYLFFFCWLSDMNLMKYHNLFWHITFPLWSIFFVLSKSERVHFSVVLHPFFYVSLKFNAKMHFEFISKLSLMLLKEKLFYYSSVDSKIKAN